MYVRFNERMYACNFGKKKEKKKKENMTIIIIKSLISFLRVFFLFKKVEKNEKTLFLELYM